SSNPPSASTSSGAGDRSARPPGGRGRASLGAPTSVPAESTGDAPAFWSDAFAASRSTPKPVTATLPSPALHRLARRPSSRNEDGPLLSIRSAATCADQAPRTRGSGGSRRRG